MYIKYLLVTHAQMLHNLCGARHLQVENHWSKRGFSVSLSRTSIFEECHDGIILLNHFLANENESVF